MSAPDPERAHQPARAHGQAQDREAVDERARADHVVGVALPRRVLDAAKRAGREGQEQELAEGHDAEQGQRAHRRRGQGLAGPGDQEQARAGHAVGEHARGHAHEGERQHAAAERGADQERRVRQLEREPAQHHQLAHDPDRVEEGAGAEAAKVAEPEQRGGGSPAGGGERGPAQERDGERAQHEQRAHRVQDREAPDARGSSRPPPSRSRPSGP